MTEVISLHSFSLLQITQKSRVRAGDRGSGGVSPGGRAQGEGPKGMGPGRLWPEGREELPTGRVSTALECTRVVQIPPPQQEDKVPSPLNPKGTYTCNYRKK